MDVDEKVKFLKFSDKTLVAFQVANNLMESANDTGEAGNEPLLVLAVDLCARR